MKKLLILLAFLTVAYASHSQQLVETWRWNKTVTDPGTAQEYTHTIIIEWEWRFFQTIDGKTTMSYYYNNEPAFPPYIDIPIVMTPDGLYMNGTFGWQFVEKTSTSLIMKAPNLPHLHYLSIY